MHPTVNNACIHAMLRIEEMIIPLIEGDTVLRSATTSVGDITSLPIQFSDCIIARW